MDSASSSQSKEISSSSSHIPIEFPASLGAHYERTKNEISNAFPSLSTTLNLINLANTTPLLDERRSQPQTPNLTNLINTTPLLGERRSQPNQRGHSLSGQLNCPRCESTNTKFLYYINYSLNQPRYFCKACRRYWTKGGSLRNGPVGGVSRKNKKPSSSSSSFSHPSSSSNTTNKLPSESNLGFNTFLSLESSSIVTDTSTSTTSSGTNPCGVMSIPEFGTGFGLPYLRRALLGLSLDGSGTVADGVGATGVGGVFGSMHQVQDSGRIKFLFGDLKPMGASTGEADQFEQNKQMVEERGKKEYIRISGPDRNINLLDALLLDFMDRELYLGIQKPQSTNTTENKQMKSSNEDLEGISSDEEEKKKKEEEEGGTSRS